ncbi:MFS transporter [Desulfurococcus amylolyticus]|uniref:MFS transporter n=1 Tax=Desulfurococcus amylolyticus TaxID=94694 RepID=UPI0023EFEF90|nr:MFS transporter [Desulfurococcus amylolyticus]
MDAFSKRIRVIIVLLAAYVLVYFHRTMTGVMKPEIDYYSGYYGVNAELLLAIMSSAYFYGYAASQFFTGPLIDYYGVKRIGSIMLTMLGVGTVLMSVPSPNTLVAGRLLIGISASVVFLSYMRSAALSFKISYQGRLSSYALFAGSISTIAATYPLRLMLNSIGLSSTYIILALLAFTLALLTYLTSSDIGGKKKDSSFLKQASLIGSIARNPHSWGVGIASVASYGLGLAYQSTWGQIHLSKVFLLGKEDVSIYLMVLAMVFAVSCIPTGYLSDKFKSRKPFLIAATIASVAAWILMYLSSISRDRIILLVALIFLGVSQGLHIVAPTMAKEYYDPKISGTSVAFFNIVLFTGIAVLQSVLSMIDPTVSVIINILIAFIGILTSTILAKETYLYEKIV